MQFRKKPVVIEAVQWTGTNWSELREHMADKTVIAGAFGGIVIPTLEGNMTADIYDWIIRGVEGEYYPCKPDIFEKTYERVES